MPIPKFLSFRIPAPFIQIKILKILASLGAGDKAASDHMYHVIQSLLRRAQSNNNIGNAIIYECVRTITAIHPNANLLATAAEAVSAFLKNGSHNLKYIGIDLLTGIVKISPQYGQVGDAGSRGRVVCQLGCAALGWVGSSMHRGCESCAAVYLTS